ncbi:Tubulin/FtsZ, GTPase domain-containing protein, partial [Gaertneriomyces semiglobifer]
GTSGRGNNWAHGFWDINRLDSILDVHRRLAERSDAATGTLLLHSIAGGTGSGLGSRLVEEIRDAYPHKPIIACAIAPFASGETALQHYNSLLALSWLQKHADFVGLFPNDIIMDGIQRQFGVAGKSDAQKVTLDMLNKYIAQCLAGILLPTTDVTPTEGGFEYAQWVPSPNPLPFDPSEFASSLAPTPGTKIGLFSTSETVVPSAVNYNRYNAIQPSWDDQLTSLTRNVPVIPGNSKRTTIAARLQARGVLGSEYWQKVPIIESRLKKKLGIPESGRSKLHTIRREVVIKNSVLYGLDIKSPARSLTMAYNSNDVFPIVSDVVASAKSMLEEKAYLHWYERYGGNEMWDVFDESVELLETVCENYQALAR